MASPFPISDKKLDFGIRDKPPSSAAGDWRCVIFGSHIRGLGSGHGKGATSSKPQQITLW